MFRQNLGALACTPLLAPEGPRWTPCCVAVMERSRLTSQFLAVKITDVTKLPKATSRAASISFQEMP